jgi:Na+/proline symporter
VARNSALGAGALYIGIGSISVLIGLLAGSLVGPVEDAEQIVPAAARLLLSPWAYVIFAGGFISAILSTVDSTLLVSAGLLSHNLVLPAMRPVSERAKVMINRGAVAMFGLIAYVIARRAEGVSAIVEMASAFGSAGILVTVTFGLFTRYGGAGAALATLATGMLSFVAASLAGATTPFLISLAASLLVYLAVGALERARQPQGINVISEA